MLNIPASIKTLFKTDGVRKNFRAHFPNGEYSDITNSDVVAESVKFTESLCSQDVFRFGCAEASVLEFETVGVGNMYGMKIEAGIEIDTSSLSSADISTIQAGTWDGTLVLAADSDIGYGFFRVPLGVFRVESCPRNHGAMTHRQVTAYSAPIQNKNGIPNFPEISISPKIMARASALMAVAFGQGLVDQATETVETTNSYYGEFFWDASGTRIRVTIWDEDASTKKNMYKEANVLPNNVMTAATLPAFVEAVIPNFNAATYEAFGIGVAEAITNAGFDITYNDSRVKIYSDNEAALRARCPWLFYPCIKTKYSTSGTAYEADFQKITPNTLAPAIAPFGTAADAAFCALEGKYTIANARFLCVGKYAAGTNVRVVVGTTNLYPALSGYLTTAPTLKKYGLSSYDSFLVINNTGALTKWLLKQAGDLGDILTVSSSAYSYVGSVNLLSLINGYLEINAQFSKDDRSGGHEAVRLDNSAPISVLPGDYSDCWWDEYNIDPVGAVIVTYSNNDEDTTAEITIGTGGSVYDMSDNEALKSIESSDFDDIATLLESSFGPYANSIGFTPAELTMQGWPWIEAGDALEITAEDGTLVETYALRIEITGIQNLMANITAQGGQIIEEVE